MPPVVSARKAQSANVAWFAEVVEAPRVNTPDTNALSRRQRRYRVRGVDVRDPHPCGHDRHAGLHDSPQSSPAAVASSGAASSAGKVAATIQVEKWLKAIPDPLPNGRIVSWDGAYDIPLANRRREAPRGLPTPSRSR